MLTLNTSTDSTQSLYYGSCDISVGGYVSNKANSEKMRGFMAKAEKIFNEKLIFRRQVFVRI